ncbi:MAG: hypothetical protein QF619_04340 [Candidatus Binatia bacterium]|jgi:hypothetical protein|nr:hypothetical protein [Candidatus Binatia bacterium]
MEKKIFDDRLSAFFLRLTRRGFWELGINDAAVARYLADVLAEFARADNLYHVRSRTGKKLDSVTELVMSSGPQGVKDNPPLRERALHKCLSDYSLFMSGIFRPYVERMRVSRYLREGRRFYWNVSELDLSLYRTGFLLFQELSNKFEYYSGALDYVRKAYFAPKPGKDPFAGFWKQVEGWRKVNVTEN